MTNDWVGQVASADSVDNTKSLPDVTVVIATCNRPLTLVESIQSVLDQKDVSVEVIVVDDSERHSAAYVIEQLSDPRVRYVVNRFPSRGRPATARNIGVTLASGNLLHFLDDDDLVADGYYAACQKVFSAHACLGVVFGIIKPFGLDEVEIENQSLYFGRAARRARRCRNWGGRWPFIATMLFGPTLMVCSAGLVRRSHVTAIQGFDTDLSLVEDVDFYIRAMRYGGVQFLNHPALGYRIGPSLMRQPGRNKMLIESYEHLQTRYRAQYGITEFLTLKVLAKGLRLT
jgi:glycosyltransferase involved in cell wall biosynthesis